ncbi:MAG: MltA domain-containing protein [Nitrospinota bacterium]|nr:MltA domain-containing protein [Nitrospinota bacterium]
MHKSASFFVKSLSRAGRWAICGFFCLALGACSTTGLNSKTDHKASPWNQTSANLETVPLDSQLSVQTTPVSYRNSPYRNSVIDLPEAGEYLQEKNRHWVDRLETAPKWMRTPENLPPPDHGKMPLVSPPVTGQDSAALSEMAGDQVLMDDMSRGSLRQAIRKQLQVMENTDLTQKVRFGKHKVTRQRLVDTLHAFMDLLDQGLSDEEFNRRLNEDFEVITAGYPKAGRPVVFTGYYTPIIPARREMTGEYVYPLYQKPDWYPQTKGSPGPQNASNPDPGYHLTQVRNRVLLTREDIDGHHALSNQQLELAWLKDDLERYFLHIQGSGYLAFPDGSLQAVQYMGSNHYPYHSVGRQMIQDGAIEPAQGSMQGMKQYFREHPEDIDKYLFRNNRYIFFKMSDSGPRGSGGAELIAGRSIATDKSLYPAGGLAYITVEKPILNDELEITGWQKVSRFVVDQDTGAAIKGPGRVDLYFGVGEPAGAAAGHYKRTGAMIYLLKK